MQWSSTLMGELDCIMMATADYTDMQDVVPGWKAFGGSDMGMFALRCPETWEPFPDANQM